MLKGVNHQVVEINRPESRYFERIMFVVKPEFSSLSTAKLLKDAEKSIGHASAMPPRTKKFRDNKRQYLWLHVLSAVVIVALLIALFLK